MKIGQVTAEDRREFRIGEGIEHRAEARCVSLGFAVIRSLRCAVIGSLHYVVICSQLATNVAVNTLRCHLLYKVGAEERISDCELRKGVGRKALLLE